MTMGQVGKLGGEAKKAKEVAGGEDLDETSVSWGFSGRAKLAGNQGVLRPKADALATGNEDEVDPFEPV